MNFTGIFLQRWRKDNHIHESLEKKIPERDEFRKLYPHGVHGFGKAGHLIYIDRAGSLQPKQLLKQFGGKDESIDMAFELVKAAHIQMMEELGLYKDILTARTGTIPMDSLGHFLLLPLAFKACLQLTTTVHVHPNPILYHNFYMFRPTGKTYYKHIVILDLGGFSMSHMGSTFRGAMHQMVDIDQNFYPETLYKMFVINAPFVFKAMWKLVSPWLDPITLQRISFGDDKINEFIDENNLPSWIKGGKCKCAEGKCCVGGVPFLSGDGKDQGITLSDHYRFAKEQFEHHPNSGNLKWLRDNVFQPLVSAAGSAAGHGEQHNGHASGPGSGMNGHVANGKEVLPSSSSSSSSSLPLPAVSVAVDSADSQSAAVSAAVSEQKQDPEAEGYEDVAPCGVDGVGGQPSAGEAAKGDVDHEQPGSPALGE